MNNYSTHALEFFSSPEGRRLNSFYPRSRDAIDGAILALQDAQKFLMPEYGRVFANGTRRGDFRDLLRLPYPTCVIEYFCPAEIERSNSAHLVKAEFFPKRRIAILIDTAQIEALKSLSDRSVLVIGCCEVEPDMWSFLPSAAILNPDTVDVDPETGLFSIVPFPFLQEVWDSPSYTMEEKAYDIADEVTAAVEFMMTINCENVTRERVPAPAKLNKKREASGKLPFNDYWVLDVFKEQRAAGGGGGGGSHASPRAHFRRGHIRRLASGKSTFVRHTMVGSVQQGIVQKAYNLKPTARKP